ncbi:transmembrane protein 128-like [Diadema antillarum]|uniref:transmembrane protein 128-like n=1 Tax=Diadema antillarum TaxID=105358 RepID=UPI003A8C06A1
MESENVTQRSQSTGQTNVTSTETEYELRRRRIAKVFMDAYGTDILKHRKLDQKKLEDLEEKEKEEAGPTSPYNFQTFFWILGTFTIFYFTDFIPSMLYDPQVKRTWLFVGFGFLAINVSIAIYLIVFCSWMRKINDWERHVPTAIPIATCSFVCGSLCLNIALWPVYGFLTPLMLFTIFMGFVVVVSLLPNSL